MARYKPGRSKGYHSVLCQEPIDQKELPSLCCASHLNVGARTLHSRVLSSLLFIYAADIAELLRVVSVHGDGLQKVSCHLGIPC